MDNQELKKETLDRIKSMEDIINRTDNQDLIKSMKFKIKALRDHHKHILK